MSRNSEKIKQTISSRLDVKKSISAKSSTIVKSSKKSSTENVVKSSKSLLENQSQPSTSYSSEKSRKSNENEVQKSVKSGKSIKSGTSEIKQIKLIPANLDELVEKFKKSTDDHFIYLTYAVDESSKHFAPYNLAEVPFSMVDKKKFFTMSRHGVVFITRKEKYITSLNDWYQEYQIYCKLVNLGVIKKFFMYKIFMGWRRFIQRKKYVIARSFIKENLFFVIPDLAKSILQLRKEWYQLIELNFINITLIEEWHPFYFIETQMELLEKIGDKLKEFRQTAKLILYQGGLKVMTSRGFNPFEEIASFPILYKMNKFYQLYFKFLKYCDFMAISLFNLIVRNSFKDLASAFEKHNQCAPSLEEILNNTSLDVQLEKPRPQSLPQNPLFIAELVLKTEKVEVDPSETIMTKTFVQLMDLIIQTVSSIQTFTNDPFYLQLVQIDYKNRMLDKNLLKPPNLSLVLNNDEELRSYRFLVLETIQITYEKVEAYMQRFEQIRKSYEEDVNTDRKLIQAEGEIQALRNYCERYHRNIQNLEGILSTINLGLLKLKQNTFKNVVTPVCRDLLNVLENYIPRLAIEEVKIVSQKTNDLMEKITATPTNTLEYVNFLRFLKNADVLVEDIFKELDYAHALFIISKDFNFSIEQEEKEKFMDCEDMAIECKEMLAKNKEKNQKIINELAREIQTDIRLLFDQVHEVASEIQDPKFTDKNSEPKVVKSQLDVLADRLNQCHQQAHNLKTYQKEFKIEVTRFDELDKCLQEVRNRQNLWNGVIEWQTSLNKWQNTDFYTLDVEEIKQINTKILNMCTQFERSLPQNELVPTLKENVETFKEKLPVITCLRNPNLKMRHWSLIEQILQRKLYQQEGITLQIFDEANVYQEDIANQMMDIAYQASEEARAENKLKEIESTAQKTNMSIVQHKDVSDAYILAGIDELQVIIDDINVNVNNLAASRHIELIKPEVDKWLGLMEQIYKTLDELQTCQTNWMYLQAIFSAPDIQRQIPQEARVFADVDKKWKELMTKAYRKNQAVPFLGNAGHYEILKENNNLLETVSKRLEAYLEVKRTAFPRFFFLSNDELLEILAETKNPHAVQPFLMKCFDAIARIEFGSLQEGGDSGRVIETNDIVAMISPEGERLEFGKGLKARGAVEDWLSKVEEAMFIAVKRYMKSGYQMYPTKKRSEWFKDHPNQIVLTISQQQWAAEIHSIFEKSDRANVLKAMKQFQQKSLKELSTLAAITREDIPRLLRKVLCALITIDVHAKDTVANLVEKRVTHANDFNWLKMLRYYWRNDNDTVTTKMASASIPYYYEYLGAGGVLVITPLTDRCYLCLTGALQMDLGGAPAGPAGTGKTETTKDLAKALAKQCVVFNCSEGLDFKMMGRFFTGLAQCGAWCCFDEFNRIDIEVLSVIAQQLITIKNAKSAKSKKFMFEGREIKLNSSCAVFITMNPGYAGRTELPDNLKALFRPIAMMVPDYALISEVILYSEGFEKPKILAHKMVQMYKLCSEQLSQQNHYDFGMRAVKSVLVMAGSLKRASPDQREDVTLIAALRDSNLPKFLVDDAKLFEGILGDLFPGVQTPEREYGELRDALKLCIEYKHLQPTPSTILKCIQLYETMVVRWGVMLVGPTGGGKTSVLHSLADALGMLYENGVDGSYYRKVNIQTLNPKAVTVDELYGAVDPVTLEWQDGILGYAVRTAAQVREEIHQWVVCDGPVDAVWIENMNTVLDDNKMLCLANSERIKLTPWIHMVFEVQDLAQASPATVSRCGMVYVDPEDLDWLPLLESWNNKMKYQFPKDIIAYMFDVQVKYFNEILDFDRKGVYLIHQVKNAKIAMFCTLCASLIGEVKWEQLELGRAKSLILKIFVWSTLWAIGSNYTDSSRQTLEEHIREVFKNETTLKMPEESLWECKINLETEEWQNWTSVVQPFTFDPNAKYFDLQVPTADTTKFGYVAHLLFNQKHPVLFTGETGVGKSILAATTMNKLMENNFIPVSLSFSSQTSSLRTQRMIEGNLQKTKRTQLSAPKGKTVIIFIDDVNMPKLDTYGSQPPIELLRQVLDFSGFYERKKLFWTPISGVLFGAACAPPGGGRNPITPRFLRHFALLSLPKPNESTLHTIFSSILQGFLSDFSSAIKALANPITNACVEVYTRIAKELLPTPDKSHYVFNLRDLSKCVQGILQSDSSNYANEMQILRLFYHETSRVFHDRLINETDKTYFKELISSVSVKYFNTSIVKPNEKIFFGDFIIFGQPISDRIYEEITNLDKLGDVLIDYMDDYNSHTGLEVKLIFFENALEHVIRIARLLRADRGNGLLVGVAGAGKQSLSRLAAHINGFRCMQIELTRNYDSSAFHDDLRNIYRAAGVQNKGTVFLFPDFHIIEDDFLEDVSNILNSGEVPNLFEGDDYEKILIDVREACNIETNSECSRDDIFKFFINRIRNNLHVIITMSPIGDAFRRRCRMFPSLVNCCTIDWFDPWPAEALYSVALGLLYEIEPAEEIRIKLAQTSVFMHKTVEEASVRFYQELRRYYHTTPSSYLELLKLYKDLLKKRSDQIIAKRKRISTGLDKIFQTNELVAVMQKELEVLYPELENQSASMKELLSRLEVDNKNADAVKEAVSKDENIAKEKAAACQAIADDAQKDLEIAMPALREAEDALKSLNKTDINEIRAFASPPQLVQFVLEAVCILMDVKPNWASAKALMADVNFLKRLVEFDKESIPEATLKKIKKYVEHKDFVPAKIEKVSKVAKSVCQWVIAIDKFAKVYKIVEPKINKRKAADDELKVVMQILRSKQQQLAEIEAEVQALKDKIDEKTIEFKRIQDDVDLTVTKINRAERLTSALSEEEVRWADTVKKLTEELRDAPGDVLIASACVAYLGAFSSNFRKDLTQKWVENCRNSNIPSSGDFNVVDVLGDQYELRLWAKAGLPRDQVSIENGLYASKALRWPLMIDPQEQANRWIRNLEKENNLHVTKSSDSNLIRVLEMCVQQGYPLLIEEVGEKIDPTLKPILKRITFVSNGMLVIKLTDTTINYHQNFKLYMTTKLANPHYMPEVCINVTLINFSVTPKGLEDQLLADIGAIEQPELEAQRNEMVVQINSDKQQLLILEDKVLKLLFGSKGSILDDEVLVETLNEVKETSLIIAARLVDTEETEAKITAIREEYRSLASRGAILYFVIASLAEINPMYQYSLKYFVQIFCNVLRLEQPKMTTKERISKLKVDELVALRKNISRGLFEVHKLIFTFLLATAVEKQDGHITENEYNFFIRGPVGATEMIEKPEYINLKQREWQNCQYLEQNFKSFEGLTKTLQYVIEISIGEYKEIMSFSGNLEKSPVNWNTRLTLFQKLMLIKSLKNEKVTIAIASYVRVALEKSFLEDDGGGNLKTIYEDISSVTPLVFVLSQGSDPMSAFIKFATDMNFIEKFYSISLGQGQGPIAESYIERGSKLGYWVFLQNCHLATSWMETLENIIRKITLGMTKTHVDYRLFLSTMPTKAFPISVLQNSVKITNEPPKGIKANVSRALSEVKEEFFERHALGKKWRSLVFGLFMFHSVLLERRKFGPLGWNISYEFNESDRECALQILDIFIDRERAKSIPWDAIVYINGEITWGGRVTDHWDQRCLRTIMKTFCSPEILNDNYSYGISKTYRDPRKKLVKDYKKYVSSLPLEDDPEIFGMHENSSIVFQSKETDFFISTLLMGQPRSTGGQSESKEGEIVTEIIEQISKRLVKKIDTENIHPDLLKIDEKGRVPPLSTVLLQEIDRYNILLKIVHSSIDDLSKAVKGFIVMSEQLENIMNSLLINFVPNLWSSRGFLSIKNLPNWIADFERRIDFIQSWCKRGAPISFWMSGFYFPQSFLTGILQTHARKYNLPIDALKIDFEVSNVTIDQQNIFENHKLDTSESSELYNGLICPEIGIYVHGLFIEAGRWNESEGGLCDSKKGELFSRLPVVWFKPCEILHKEDRYEAPLYKTQARAGVLSTTGHSTNFVHSILLKSELKSDYWILRGTALVTAVSENLA